MSNWKKVSDFVIFSTKGITPIYVESSSIIVLNQKCIRTGSINYLFAKFTDDTKQIQETKFIQKGDILVNSTGTGTAGRCAFVSNVPENHRLIVDSHILILRCNSFYEAQCLSYLLFSFEQNLMSFMTGSSGQSELDKVVLMHLKTKMPSDETTLQKIATVLSDLDSKIELNNRINAELEAMAKTLYNYWFVQFDFPDKNGKPYKTNGGKMVWNEELKREIPEGWEVEPLFKAMDVQYGFPFSTSKFTDEVTDKPVIRIRDILENTISTYTTEEVDDKYRLKQNDLLIGMDGNFHLNFWDKDGAYLNQRSVRIRAKNDSEISNLQAYFELKPYIKARENNVSRTTVGHLSDKDLKRLFLISPSRSDLFKPKNLFENSLSEIISNRLQNQKLTELRDWLLPMLMNGQVKVN